MNAGPSPLIEQWNGVLVDQMPDPVPYRTGVGLPAVSCGHRDLVCRRGRERRPDPGRGVERVRPGPPSPAPIEPGFNRDDSPGCLVPEHQVLRGGWTGLLGRQRVHAVRGELERDDLDARRPRPTGPGGPFFNAVSCTASTSAWPSGTTAVGTRADRAVERHRLGRRSRPRIPRPERRRSRDGCLVHRSLAWCIAAGEGCARGRVPVVVEQWNGTAWRIVSTPNVGCGQQPPAGRRLLQRDVLFGRRVHGLRREVTATEALVWNGASWSPAPPRIGRGPTDTQLNRVSCVPDWACVGRQGWPSPAPPGPFVITAPIARSGYRFVASDGGMFSYGSRTPFLGSLGGTRLNAADRGPGRHAGRGRVLPRGFRRRDLQLGSAKFHGSAGGPRLEHAHRRHGRDRATAAGTGSSPRTAACSGTAMPSSTARREA